MKITLTQEELREITRLFLLGILVEDIMLDDENIRGNEEEKAKDYRCLLFKLIEEGKKEGVKISIIDEVAKDLEKSTEQGLKSLIENRKRTYTSKYWNYIDNEKPS